MLKYFFMYRCHIWTWVGISPLAARTIAIDV